MKTIAVFFGGRSNEREISVITGMYAVNLLRESYRVLPVYLDPDGGLLLGEHLRGVEDFRCEKGIPKGVKRAIFTRGGIAEERKPKKKIFIDCALNCCHGGAGEGGALSALLEWYGIPSASPQTAPSAVFMDKELSKLALKGLGVPVLPSFGVREEELASDGWRERARELGYPVIVKPCKLGSSIGISVAENEEALFSALSAAFRLDGQAIVEKYLKGKRDLNVAAYRRGETIVLSPIEEVFSGEPILTFREKYEGSEERRRELPAKLGGELEQKIADMLKCVYAQFGIKGVVRADFLLSEEGEAYFNELNTVPGTLATYLFSESLSGAKRLLTELLEEGMSEKPRKEVLDSGILFSPVFGAKNSLKRHI